MEVIDPAKAQRFFGPGKNERLVAVRLRVENVGTLPYSDSPSNGAVLIDTADQGYDASMLDSAAGREPEDRSGRRPGGPHHLRGIEGNQGGQLPADARQRVWPRDGSMGVVVHLA